MDYKQVDILPKLYYWLFFQNYL